MKIQSYYFKIRTNNLLGTLNQHPTAGRGDDSTLRRLKFIGNIIFFTRWFEEF